MSTSSASRRAIFSWALYDWANSAFATTVMAGFFPLFFKQYWSAGVDASTSTLRLGVANSIGSLVIAGLAPLLGALADAGQSKKVWLFRFTLLGSVCTGALALVGEGNWSLAAFLYILASLGFLGGIVFYDSLLVAVAPPGKRDRVSALGYSLGYLGGGLLFAVNAYMVMAPDVFGLADKGQAVRLSFVTVALWWGLWALPLFLAVKEPSVGVSTASKTSAFLTLQRALLKLSSTFRKIRSHRNVYGFLFAYWLYIDGVDTIIRMAVDYGLALGLESSSLIQALLLTQLVGFPAALVFGRLGERIGAKRGIVLGLLVYLGLTTYAAFLTTVTGFFIMAGLVGLVQGGVQALSRSYYSTLIPGENAGEFFGFYNMLGKFAAIVGPLLIGAVGALTGSPRWSILSLIPLFAVGGYLLLKVEEPPSTA